MASDPIADVRAALEESDKARAATPPKKSAAAPPTDDPIVRLRETLEQSKSAKSPAASSGSGMRDYYADAINYLAGTEPIKNLPEGVKFAGRMVIPQNTPELAVAAATSLFGGPLAGVAGKGLTGALMQAGKVGLKAGAAGALGAAVSGHDPMTEGALGVLGGGLGDIAGQVARNFVQSKAVRSMLDTTTETLADSFRSILGGRHLSSKSVDVMKDVASGELLDRVTVATTDWAERQKSLPMGAVAHMEGINVPPKDWAQAVKMRNATNPVKYQPGSTPGSLDFAALWEASSLEDRGKLLRYLPLRDQNEFKALMQEGKIITGVQNFLTGGDPAATERLFDRKTGKLTMEGWAELQDRVKTAGPQLEQELGPNARAMLEQSLFAHLSPGFAGPVAGQATQLHPRAGVGMGGVHLFPHVQPGKIPYAPGWETVAGPKASIYPGLVRGILADEPSRELTAQPKRVGQED